jgi:trans-aconitate methyltransferase
MYAAFGVFFLILVSGYSTLYTGVPTFASSSLSRRKIIEVLMQQVAAHVGDEAYTIVDLGSGSGLLADQIARALPQTSVTGVEISIVLWALSSFRRAIFGPPNLQFFCLDFQSYDCSTCDAVVAYLPQTTMGGVGHKLHTEAKPGAVIITNEMPLQSDWQPTQVLDTGGFFNVKIFVYRQTSRVSGK